MQKKKIDNYSIFLNEKLGEGSFGSVFLGEKDKTKEKVAVKMLSKKKINKDDYIKEAMYSEIQILKILKSDNIVKCLDVMESSNYYYIIQEYCKDGELRALMDKKKTMTEVEALDILYQICNGIICMLSQGIIHRDLKPENILINNGVFKICDFGFSKKLPNKRMKNRTVVGTPLYMSIEILKNQYYTTKCDIWALGFILYEMLHGKTPWTASTQFQLISNIQNKELIFGQGISNKAKDLLSKMLQIREKDRIDWDALFKHPIFNGRFKNYIDKNIQLQSKLKYLMSQLRYTIKSQNIDLQKLFFDSGYTKQTELSFKHFNQFLNTIDSNISNEEQVYIFTLLDKDDSNTISFSQLESQMKKHNIPMRSKHKDKQNISDTSGQKQNQYQSKVKAVFNKLSVRLKKNKVTLVQVFEAYDTNKDGDLTINEFKRIMNKLDDKLTYTEIQYAFSLVDYDGSGAITFDEFYHYYCKCIGEPPKNYMTKRQQT